MFARVTSRSSDDLARRGLWLSTALVLAMMIALSGCNTMRGAGEDIEAAGGAMSGTAEDVEDEM